MLVVLFDQAQAFHILLTSVDAYRYNLEYTAVFWVSGESMEQILASFLAIAELPGLPERQEANQQRMVVAVQRWLCSHGKWLLIWDNLEEVELLRHYLPPTRRRSRREVLCCERNCNTCKTKEKVERAKVRSTAYR